MKEKMKIGTIASHSALNILSGAKKEGFETVLYIQGEKKRALYESFEVADEIIELESYDQFFEKVEEDTVIIPHGSFVAYLSLEKILSSKIPFFGNKELLLWEADREKKAQLMKEASLTIPKETTELNDINFPCIVKYDGAEGGKGYFVANSQEEVLAKLDRFKKASYQEWIVGTKVYTTFFNSIIRNRLELFGTDIRYETDLDAKIRFDDDYAFQIIGNIPMVLRESLLVPYYEMGLNFVEAVKTNLSHPMIGPFCLETIINRDLEIYCFEFSGRIVAGTNIFVPNSPYSYITFMEEMWMGRRMALELKEAIEQDRLMDVLV
ncbi:MAG: formate--phosphoribosylaminoimidazolecarboxamide ligase [Candidatus Kariarchaeaceae archaeon]